MRKPAEPTLCHNGFTAKPVQSFTLIPMQTSAAGATAGLIGGFIMSSIMIIGRRTGCLHPTLNEHAENWLDRTFDTRNTMGSLGTTALALATHMATSGLLGVGYANSRRYSQRMRPVVSGALFGGALYLIDIVLAAPLIGITRGEHNERPSVALQRLATHVIFGIATALAAERLTEQKATSLRLR